MTREQPPAPPPHLGARRDQSVAGFVSDLRQFVVHRSLLSTLSGTGGVGGKPEASLSTELSDLLRWNGWSPSGRAFLSTMGPADPLDHVLAPYKTLVVEFCAWLGKWQAAVHRGALEELSDLQMGFRNPDAAPRRAARAVFETDAAVPASLLTGRLAPQLAS